MRREGSNMSDPLAAPSDQEPHGPHNETPSSRELIDLYTFVLLLAATGCGILLYFKPAIGAAVLGALTALAILLAIVTRRR